MKIIEEVLDRWKAGIDAHQPQQVAALFTEDAIFQGLRPYSVGRPEVAAYYDSQPLGLTAEYRLVETRTVADDVVLGYAAVDFRFTDRPDISVHLGVLLKRTDEGGRIAHYQVTRLD